MKKRGLSKGEIFLFAAFLTQPLLAQLPPVPLGQISIELQTTITGLSQPIDLVSAHDGASRLFVAEQTGKIRVFKNGTLLATPFLDLSGRIVISGERGLLSIAFHPGFNNPASPGFRKFYTYESEPVFGTADFTVSKSGPFDNQSVLSEWRVSASSPDVADPASRREVLRIDHPQSNHNGAKLAFRASDGYLYISLGDGGGGNDTADGHAPNVGNGQSLNTVLGKILRIDPLAPASTTGSADAPSANGKYRVPQSNPFVGRAGLDEIYAYGFRNPFRYSFDPPTDRFILADVGQNSIEEIDLVQRGRNYGWNRKEGSFLFNPANGSVSPDSNPNPAFTNPIAEYDHDDGVAIIGGFVYRGSAIPALAGKYVCGDFSAPPNGDGRLFHVDVSSGAIQEFRLGATVRSLGTILRSIGEDDNHELYLLTGSQAVKLISLPVSPGLLNLSTRARVETGDGVLIGGFIVTGSAPKNFVLRALGPSLNVGGQPISGRLTNPILELHDGSGALITSNDDWMTSPLRQQIINQHLQPPDSRESALFASLQPGAYTAIMRGVGNTSGIGLVEIYDVDQAKPANAINISARGRVRTGDNVMIAGFALGGNQSRDVLLRALGPSLTTHGITGVLQNPTLELHNSSGALIAFNDNWRTNQEAAIDATGLAPTNNNESAIFGILAPGNYTAVVRGANNSIGIALAEVYQVPP